MADVWYLDNTPGELGCVLKAEINGKLQILADGWYRDLEFPHPEGACVGPFPTREAALEGADD